MNNYNIHNKEFLLSLKPSFNYIPIIILIGFIIILISLFSFKSYDVYTTYGYLECDEKCNVTVSINIKDINNVKNANLLKINNKDIEFKNIVIGKIEVDEVNKINVQTVSFEVGQLDNDELNTIQEIKIYSNNESIFTKVKKIVI